MVEVAVTQKTCALLLQLASELHPAALQKPPAQMVPGGPDEPLLEMHSTSFAHAIWHALALHCARGLLVD
jgi:hypothetical protein